MSSRVESWRLIGAWKLASARFELSTGEVLHQFGEHPEGLLIYAQTGQMSAHIVRCGRARFVSDEILAATQAETKIAFDGLISYFGTYDVDEAAGTVSHHVAGSSFPNWENETQVRNFHFRDGLLTLTTPAMPFKNGASITGVLEWKKVTTAEPRS
jgi:Lipocalin-like domain